jgi:hypothetical protein
LFQLKALSTIDQKIDVVGKALYAMRTQGETANDRGVNSSFG